MTVTTTLNPQSEWRCLWAVPNLDVGLTGWMSANAKQRLPFCLAVFTLVGVVCFVLRDPIRVQYHKAAFSVKCNNAYKLIPFGNYRRGKGIHFSWDVDPHTDLDVDALVQLGYLVKREFTFEPPVPVRRQLFFGTTTIKTRH